MPLRILDNVVAVFLNPVTDNFSFGPAPQRKVIQTLAGGSYVYNTGSYYTMSVPLNFVSSADAFQLNEWWRTRAGILVQYCSVYSGPVSATYISSGFVAGASQPMRRVETDQFGRWNGTVLLESW